MGFASEMMSIGATIFALDSSGILVAFSQLIKTLTLFRFINVYFGDLLENFMMTLGQNLEQKNSLSRNEYIANGIGSRGKFTRYDKPISTFKPYYLKIVLYLISWMVKIWSRIMVRIAKGSRKINKFVFYIIYFH